MPDRIEEFARPSNWEEAVEALRRPGTPSLSLVIGPRPAPLDERGGGAAIDLRRLDLAYIRQDGTVIRIGGLTPLQDVAQSSLLQSTADGLLSQAADIAGGLGIRHVASVAGALAGKDGPPEVALALLALETVAVVRPITGGRREVALSEFLAAPTEPLEEVGFEAQASASGSLQRVARTPRDQAIVAAAVAVETDAGLCRQARIAVAGAGPSAVRLKAVEAMLAGKRFGDGILTQAAEAASAAVEPEGDYRGSAAYRRAMAGTLVRRALAEAWQRAGGQA